MKRVYLVRHRETDANLDNYVQGVDEPLNSTGIKQANILAHRLQNINFEKLVVSDYHRAQMTALPVSELTGIEAEPSQLFREEKKPTSYIGMSKDLPEAKQFSQDFIKRAADKTWRVEDMETPFEILERVKKAVEFLEKLPEENIVVISHGDYLKLVLGYLMLGKTDDVSAVMQIRKNMKSTNTGVSMIYYKDDYWKVLTFNDHAHFAE